jgi:hypothetical protein
MKKYSVYGIISASVFLGEYEAESKEEAVKMAEENRNANWHPTLCWQCAGEVELGDVYDTQVEEIEP